MAVNTIDKLQFLSLYFIVIVLHRSVVVSLRCNGYFA